MKLEVFEITPDQKPKGWTRKMGTFGWVGDDLYIPAGATGVSEAEIVMACAYDGEPVAYHGGWALVREEWARREYPRRGAVYAVLRTVAINTRVLPTTSPRPSAV